MDTLMTKEAYRAMFYFLEHCYELTKSEDLAGLLGELSLLEDGSPADPAAWEDWLKAIERARNDEDSIKLRLYK